MGGSGLESFLSIFLASNIFQRIRRTLSYVRQRNKTKKIDETIFLMPVCTYILLLFSLLLFLGINYNFEIMSFIVICPSWTEIQKDQLLLFINIYYKRGRDCIYIIFFQTCFLILCTCCGEFLILVKFSVRECCLQVI